MQRGLVDDLSRKDGIAILHVGDSKPIEPLGPAPIEVPFYPDLINGHPCSFHMPSRYFGCGLRAIILPRTRVNSGLKARDASRSYPAAVARRVHNLADGVYDELGPVELDVMGAVLRHDELAVLGEVRKARLELGVLLIKPFRLSLREAGVLAGPRAQDDQRLLAQRGGSVGHFGHALVYGRRLVERRVEVASAAVERVPLPLEPFGGLRGARGLGRQATDA